MKLLIISGEKLTPMKIDSCERHVLIVTFRFYFEANISNSEIKKLPLRVFWDATKKLSDRFRQTNRQANTIIVFLVKYLDITYLANEVPNLVTLVTH